MNTANPIGLALAASILAGCATVDVRSVGTNTGQRAFDLRGTGLAALDAEAQRLCPQGHEVLRQWQQYGRSEGADTTAAPSIGRFNSLAYDAVENQAQMTVVCRA